MLTHRYLLNSWAPRGGPSWLEPQTPNHPPTPWWCAHTPRCRTDPYPQNPQALPPAAGPQSWGCMHRWVFIKKTWLSAMHSHAFRWFSATTLVFLFLGFLPLQLNYIWRIFSVLCKEKKVGRLYLFVCKNYISLTCLSVFFTILNFDNIWKKVIFLFGPCFSMETSPRKPGSCLDFKNQGKKCAKTRKLGFFRND